MDRLEEIPLEDLYALRRLYENKDPENFTAIHTLENYNRWFKENYSEVAHVKVCCLNGNWAESGTFVIIDHKVLIFNTFQPSGEILKQTLSLIDYKDGFVVTSFRSTLYPIFQEIVKLKNLEMDEVYNFDFSFLSKKEALKFEVEIPVNLKIKSLGKEHIDLLDEYWIGKYEGSKQFLERLVMIGHSQGIFNENGALVAWVLRREYGVIGNLQVLEEYQGKGFGTLLTKSFCKHLSQEGYDCTVNIFSDNTKSVSLFQKLGFEQTDKFTRCVILPSKN